MKESGVFFSDEKWKEIKKSHKDELFKSKMKGINESNELVFVEMEYNSYLMSENRYYVGDDAIDKATIKYNKDLESLKKELKTCKVTRNIFIAFFISMSLISIILAIL